jgi:uncharacterized protein (TIGR00251 family)
MARITVKVQPRARRSEAAGRVGDAWKFRLAAPPVDGKANQECIRLLAELAGVPRAAVRILGGETARTKLVEIDGLEQEELERRLSRY